MHFPNELSLSGVQYWLSRPGVFHDKNPILRKNHFKWTGYTSLVLSQSYIYTYIHMYSMHETTLNNQIFWNCNFYEMNKGPPIFGSNVQVQKQLVANVSASGGDDFHGLSSQAERGFECLAVGSSYHFYHSVDGSEIPRPTTWND